MYNKYIYDIVYIHIIININIELRINTLRNAQAIVLFAIIHN
jgi:hypothetical protein